MQKELQEKLEKKQEAIKEAQDEYESAKASVETMEIAKIASELTADERGHMSDGDERCISGVGEII